MNLYSHLAFGEIRQYSGMWSGKSNCNVIIAPCSPFLILYVGIFKSAAVVKNYEPPGRIYHQAASVGGKVYMWGGTANYQNGKKATMIIELFDHHMDSK